MILRVVAWSARHRFAVLLAAAVTVVASWFAQRSLARDAFPDLSDPQVVLLAEWMDHSAPEVASEVTEVLTAGLADVPGSTAIRGSSMAGMAYIDVTFESTSALPAGRAEIARRIEQLRKRLPSTARVQIGPDAASTGWIFQYVLMPPERKAMPMGESAHEGRNLLEPIRKFQDEVLKPALAKVPGVAEIATVGGAEQELLIETTADQLHGAGVAFSDVIGALRTRLERAPAPTLDELGSTPLVVPGVHGQPGYSLSRVARVGVEAGMESGIADVAGSTAAVGGIVIAERDADVSKVIDGVRRVIEQHRRELPGGTRLGVLYDRSELTGRVQHTLLRALGEEVAVVLLIVLVFLLHFRSALVPMLSLPLVVLLTFTAMRLFGIPATVMSLGGIAIALGMAVDAELVALEACHRRLEADGPAGPGKERRARIVEAAGSFAPAILTSLLIAALAFAPVFAFGGETGRLLTPLALTKTLVVIGAALVTLTLAPALRDLLLRGRVVPELRNPLTRGLVRIYRPFVHFALSRPAFTLITAALAALSGLVIVPRLGSEFLPRIDEGDLLYMPTTAPGLPMEDAELELQRQDAAIAERPEVAIVFGKIGRADTATDPAPYSMVETTIRLRPRDEWPTLARTRWYSEIAPEPVKQLLRPIWPEETPLTTEELVDLLDHATQFPGWTNAWTAPVRARMDMMSTGVRTPIGVRIVADEPQRLDSLGATVQSALQRVSGTRSAVYESLGGETRLKFVPDPAALKRFGVDAELARSTAEVLLTGGVLAELGARSAEGLPGRVRLSLAAPWAPKPLEDLLRDATVRSSGASGQPVPLGLLGRPAFVTEPSMLRAEGGRPVAYVYVDLHAGVDLADYVARARSEVDRALSGAASRLGQGERIEWTGQYELLAEGQKRLYLIAPLVALSMLLLLLVQFRNLAAALIVLVSVPFALVGSVWTLYLLDYKLSAPVWVGLLSVVGLAMQTGVVMVVYIDDAFHRRLRAGLIRTRSDIIEAHAEGTVRRLRPKVMTITTMAAGLLPLMWAQGAGAEVMRRVAAPMIGGLMTSAFLTLEVIPVLYTIWRTSQLRRAERLGVPIERMIGPAPGWARDAALHPAPAESEPSAPPRAAE